MAAALLLLTLLGATALVVLGLYRIGCAVMDACTPPTNNNDLLERAERLLAAQSRLENI